MFTYKKSVAAVRALAVLLVWILASAPAHAREEWVASWGSAQWAAEGNNALPADLQRNVTIRQIVRLSLGGSSLRVHVSNAMGTEPLHILAVDVARPVSRDSGKIDAASNTIVTFNNHRDVTIPAGAELTSDPVSFTAAALASVAVTMQIEAVPARQTGHVASHATSYFAVDAPTTAAELPSAQTLEHWYFLSGIDVVAPGGAAIVAFGDSITDGSGSTLNANNRWPDVLAERLQQSREHHKLAVVNAGIGGNRMLLDGNGPNALARFDRDVLARSGVRYLILLEGINDLGMLTRDGAATAQAHDELVKQLIGAYREIVERAHSHGIQVIGGTLLPFSGFAYYHPDATNERDRQRVNAWIRERGHFDAVIDFDQLTADPRRPDWLLPPFDSGDHLHPSPAGYRAMGEAIPLELLR